MKKLALRALIKYLSGLVLVALLVFLPAGTLRFWNGRLLLAVLFLPMLPLGILLLVKAPELLEKRLHTREKETAQRSVIALSGLMFLAGFFLAGLDYRFQWLPLPRWASLAAAMVFLAGYGLYGEVMRENAYLSRTVEVQEGQRVVDTGLYGVVRHPMYLATLLMFLSIPIVLGSLIALPVFLLYLPLVVRRIRNEEAVLENGLPGYREYKKRVRYRLVPHIW